ncbi:uncharacterized protein RAG0_05914 [Rhynchosporium agropyri]|uniref:Uncharacterized protein n=1 Tax=Rhynchosporium agropyri TaxID=914238 RepID=A0A1E1KFC7_9HELO|nr:uncharacterized protein RAG0_05914 [Rhynchosporium agropyri]
MPAGTQPKRNLVLTARVEEGKIHVPCSHNPDGHTFPQDPQFRGSVSVLAVHVGVGGAVEVVLVIEVIVVVDVELEYELEGGLVGEIEDEADVDDEIDELLDLEEVGLEEVEL